MEQPARGWRRRLGNVDPTAASPLSREGWGIVIEYEEDGFVNDNDAAAMDYARLLKQMQDATFTANEERRKEGFEPVTLVGWAEPPSYAAAHKMYWAKELVDTLSEPEIRHGHI